MKTLKSILIILLLSILQRALGQSCEQISGVPFNCKDNLGRKQGFWVIGDSTIYSIVLKPPVPAYCQTAPVAKKLKIIHATGNYLDDKKIGVWKYYGGGGCVGISKVREVEWLPDGSVLEKKFLPHSSVHLNPDSTEVWGFQEYEGQIIDFRYTDRIATFKLSNGNMIAQFPCKDYWQFDFELGRLLYSHYDEAIRAAQAE